MSLDAELNSFAIRSFRDIADHDYISARLNHRAHLFPQFLWQSLQSIEKYIKCILLLNRVPATNLGHNLSKGVKLFTQLPFDITLSKGTSEFLDYLDTYARFRYLETSWYIAGSELLYLDRAVWELRRYCTVLNYSIKLQNGASKQMMPFELQKIANSQNRPYHKHTIMGGELEKVLSDKNNPARQPLVWKNFYFGRKMKKKISYQRSMKSVNSPLSLRPKLLKEVEKFIYLPKEVKNAFEERIKKEMLEEQKTKASK